MVGEGGRQSEVEKSLKGRWVGRTERAPWNRPGAARPTQKRGRARLRRRIMWKSCGFLVDNLWKTQFFGGKLGKCGKSWWKMWKTRSKKSKNVDNLWKSCG